MFKRVVIEPTFATKVKITSEYDAHDQIGHLEPHQELVIQIKDHGLEVLMRDRTPDV